MYNWKLKRVVLLCIYPQQHRTRDEVPETDINPDGDIEQNFMISMSKPLLCCAALVL